LAVVTLPPAMPLVISGKLKGLAVTTPQRSAAVKDVPTVIEAGYPSLFFLPAKTPRTVADKVGSAVLKVAEMPEIREKLTQLGFEPVSIGGDQFQRDVAVELKRWAGVIERAGIKAQ
jgi:tripartite-type tricarboxylate transporter receptor subunit TctC